MTRTYGADLWRGTSNTEYSWWHIRSQVTIANSTFPTVCTTWTCRFEPIMRTLTSMNARGKPPFKLILILNCLEWWRLCHRTTHKKNNSRNTSTISKGNDGSDWHSWTKESCFYCHHAKSLASTFTATGLTWWGCSETPKQRLPSQLGSAARQLKTIPTWLDNMTVWQIHYEVR